jgi:NAD(P)-dependent dehydrogenase (short-subunit alcohol dehydrogenase family)
VGEGGERRVDFESSQKAKGESMASVVITGTSKGIGLETAVVLARAGHTVYATMRSPEKAPELARRAEAEGLAIHVSQMDVDSDTSVAEGMAEIEKQAGVVDVLVNNAGIERHGAIEETPMSEFRAVMETNYFGALRCIKAVVAGMRERQSGCIINITSIGGRMATSPLGPYAASKFALEGLSEALAQEMKLFGVHVAIVEPGIIDTSMARGLTEMGQTRYPHTRRLEKIFAAALESPRGPHLVGEKILEIVESGTWKLRHVVGPDAQQTLDFRRSMTDEEYVALQGQDDEAHAAEMARRMGSS